MQALLSGVSVMSSDLPQVRSAVWDPVSYAPETGSFKIQVVDVLDSGGKAKLEKEFN